MIVSVGLGCCSVGTWKQRMFVIPDRFLLSFIDNSICSHDGIAKKLIWVVHRCSNWKVEDAAPYQSWPSGI